MKLYLMRHAPREPVGDFADAKLGDPEAPLTDEGELVATGMGEWLAQNDYVPTLIVAATSVRTQQTADLVVAALKDAGFDPPDVKNDVTIESFQSIRGLVLKLAGDATKKRVMLISHHETIRFGLKALQVDNQTAEDIDAFAMGEIRCVGVKRKNGQWDEVWRVRPSDLGFVDVY